MIKSIENRIIEKVESFFETRMELKERAYNTLKEIAESDYNKEITRNTKKDEMN